MLPLPARRIPGVFVGLAAALVLIAPPGAGAFSKAIWGDVARNGVNQFPLYHQLGVSIYQTDLEWAMVAPTRPLHATDPRDPAYHWPTEVGQAIAQARRFHMRVLLQIVTAPAWANGGHLDDRWAPHKPADFSSFAAAAARRYPSVHLWMVWGEPTKAGSFDPLVPAVPGTQLTAAQRSAPRLYARILDSTYAALKAVSKSNLVIGGCTFSIGRIDTEQWIQNLRLPDGRPPRMDMYAHNPFSDTEPSFSAPPSAFGQVQFSDLPRLAGWIDRYLHKGLPIFLSEWTVPTAADQEFNFWVDPSVAARWVTDALRLSRGWKRIYALGWIHVYDDPPGGSCSGLFYNNGTPKPGYYAFTNG
ncbi:MAG: hypothetical protein JO169_14945 [Solirubrobacterales bacterium]|nr:hypothetical protein [Solirubrobacterales bacterium]